jgi:uncharacterized protein YrrD
VAYAQLKSENTGGQIMKKSVEIIGLPVVSINEAKELGTVKELVINPDGGTIAALVLDDGQWYHGAKLIPFAAIMGIGEYAVTVKHSNAILPISATPDLEVLLAAGIKVTGAKVLTSAGRIQGKVTEMLIDTTGKIVNCEITETTGQLVNISAQDIYTFGKEVLIVADSSAQEAPVAATVEKEAPSDDSAKKFDEKQRKYLLGKKATRRIETDKGMLIVDNGGEITEEVLQKAKLAGKFVELSMSIQ